MKILDKIKNLFLDDVDEDEEIELEEEEKKEYKEPKDVLPKVMRETIEKEEVKKEKKKEEKISKDVEELLKKDNPVKAKPEEKKFSFPIEFETDFVPSKQNNVNVLELEREKEKIKEKEKQQAIKRAELYPPKKEMVQEKAKFRATPVISPVYGILDKNYKKDEVKERPDENVSMKRPSKKVDFETVRKKAFGNLTDEIKDNMLCENCELYKEVKKISALTEDDLLYDMTLEDEPVTIEKAYDNYEEFGVAYEPKKEEDKVETEDDNLSSSVADNNDDLITEEEENKTSSLEEEIMKESKEEKIPSRQEKKKDVKVDSDFFDLIDSMYKERNEE